MNRIVRLPPEISQKIAAGEVIERPSSVVKELVENSLDAGASEVIVELLAGGKQWIRVTDDGSGMSREDALICFERHSTSKIREEEDLAAIATLGFRGEALPSISSVSRLVLKTSEGEGGTLVEREGEETLRVQDIGFPRGTSVEVRDLFFNLPPRRKFLRSEKSELASIIKYMTGVCLAFPGVTFSLCHGKKEIFRYAAVGSLKERIFQIYGKSAIERLIEVDYHHAEMELSGHVSAPPIGRSDRRHQLFYVNKRPVKDRLLQAALNQAYRGYLEKDRFAEAFLFLSCPYAEVDVNVHPTKAEVRFRHSQEVFHFVLESAKQTLLSHQGVKRIYPAQQEGKRASRIEEPPAPLPIHMRDRKREDLSQLYVPSTKEAQVFPRILGQYGKTYIVAESEEGLLIIDQHNAHERVLFEKYKEIHKEKKWPRRLALFPLIVELSRSLILSLEENRGLLEGAGFQVEAMGGRSFALKEFPDIFRDEEAVDILLSLLEEIREEKLEEREEKFLAALACKTAVKAGQDMSPDRMNYLVEQLFQTSNPSVCPHRRPITVVIEKKEIEKGLKRSRD
ncbi:MAG: DNA mismatch repair endonuclease MutL [Candidatus Aminicenantales bacterium]